MAELRGDKEVNSLKFVKVCKLWKPFVNTYHNTLGSSVTSMLNMIPSCDSSVSKVTGCGLDDQSSVLGRSKDFSLLGGGGGGLFKTEFKSHTKTNGK
jgi:hypothetical protein